MIDWAWSARIVFAGGAADSKVMEEEADGDPAAVNHRPTRTDRVCTPTRGNVETPSTIDVCASRFSDRRHEIYISLSGRLLGAIVRSIQRIVAEQWKDLV